MTLRSRRELYKLRELVHFLLSHPLDHNLQELGKGANRIVCHFCKEPLSYSPEFKEHGNAVGPKFVEELSIHHVDGNHENNEETNKALSHRKCHKSYHRRLANQQRAAMQEVEK